MRIFCITLLIVALPAVYSTKKSKSDDEFDEDGFGDDEFGDYEEFGGFDLKGADCDGFDCSPDYQNTEESKQSGKESGNKQCGTSGKAGQMEVIEAETGDEFSWGGDDGFDFGDDFDSMEALDEGFESNDEFDEDTQDFFDDQVEDGMCNPDVEQQVQDEPEVKPDSIKTCAKDDPTDCKVVTSERPACDEDHMADCKFEPSFCQHQCDRTSKAQSELLTQMLDTNGEYKAYVEMKYEILGVLTFPTQWSWVDADAFTFKFRKQTFTQVQTQMDTTIKKTIKNSDIAMLGKAINKVRPTLQYAYYLSFHVNHLTVDQSGKNVSMFVDKISNEKYNEIKAISIVKLGKKTDTTTEIHQIRGQFEEFLLKTRLFLYHYFADSFKVFRRYQWSFRRLEKRSRKKLFKSPEEKLSYADRIINFLNDKTIPVFNHLQAQLADTMDMLDNELMANTKKALDTANAEIVRASATRKDITEVDKQFANQLAHLRQKQDVKREYIRMLDEKIEKEREDNEKLLKKMKDAQFQYNQTEAANYKDRKALYLEHKKETIDINKQVADEMKKLNEKPMPVCRLTEAGILTKKNAKIDINTPSIFDKCKIHDETVLGPRTDIIFIMDGSGSISNRDFQKGKEWVYKVSKNVIAKETKAHVTVSFLQFSSHTKWEITKANELTDLYSKLEGITQMNGGTYMVPALHEASNFVTTAGAQKVIVFLTDGQPSDDIWQACMDLKSSPVEIHAIGIGSGINEYTLQQIGTKSYHLQTWASLMQMGRLLVKTLALTVSSSWTVDMSCHNKVIDQLKTDCETENQKYQVLIEAHKKKLKNLNGLTDTQAATYQKNLDNKNKPLVDAKNFLDKMTADFFKNNQQLHMSIATNRKIQASALEDQSRIDNAFVEVGVSKLTSAYYKNEIQSTVKVLGMIHSALNIVQQALGNIRVSLEIFVTNVAVLKDRSEDMKNSVTLFKGTDKKKQNHDTWDDIDFEINQIIKDMYETQIDLVASGRLAYHCYKTMNNLRYDSINTDLETLKAAYNAASDGVDTITKKILLDENNKLRESLNQAHKDNNKALIQVLCYQVNTKDDEFQADCEGYERQMSQTFEFEVTKKMCLAHQEFLAQDLSEMYGKEVDFTRKLIEENRGKCEKNFNIIVGGSDAVKV